MGAEADGRAVRRQLRDGGRRRLALRRRASARRPGRAGAPDLTRVALCTDSSSLLSPVAAAALDVSVVPVPVALDGRAFEGSVDAFYERMRDGAAATTSQPSPGAFLAAYADLASHGATSIMSLHLDGRVSGVTASAEIAARDASIPVTVVDLPTVSYGVALCIRAAHGGLVDGAPETQAAAMAKQLAVELDNVFVARAGPRGRIPTIDEWTVLRFADGAATPVSSHTTIEDATEEMARRIAGSGVPSQVVAVGHASREVEAAADRLAHDLLRAGVAPVGRYRVEPSVGAHTGPDSFGAFWRPAESVSS
jgi:fatty acid-binding protein DegV